MYFKLGYVKYRKIALRREYSVGFGGLFLILSEISIVCVPFSLEINLLIDFVLFIDLFLKPWIIAKTIYIIHT